MRRFRAGVAAIAAPLVGVGVGSGTAYAAAATAPTITRSAHVAFENCNARNVVLSVTAPGHAFGPCGTLPFTVRNLGDVGVYPGPLVYFCTDEAEFRLGPHSTARATAHWNQAASLGSPPKPQHAPPGTYRLTVDGAVTVPVVLTSG
jgi:hypothetical protein